MNKYEESGVSLEAGYESIKKIKKHVESTNTKGVLSKLGQFGGLFDLSMYNYKKPVLVSGCDGVGTKIKLCELFDNYSNIGKDLVAMSVNDIIVQGATPLFFLDYIACGKNDPNKIEQIVQSISLGCKESNCALIGGETAEMPDVYQKGSYDLGGFAVGCVEKENIIDMKNVKPTDVIIGLPSNGLHSNGFSLVRKILLKDNQVDLNKNIDILSCSLKEELLKPTRIYVKEVLSLMSKIPINGMAHITGGGYQENIQRSLNGYGSNIFIDKINVLPIFNYISEIGKIDIKEMFNYFNMGIGYIFIVDKKYEQEVLSLLGDAYTIGEVIKKEGINLCD